MPPRAQEPDPAEATATAVAVAIAIAVAVAAQPNSTTTRVTVRTVRMLDVATVAFGRLCGVGCVMCRNCRLWVYQCRLGSPSGCPVVCFRLLHAPAGSAGTSCVCLCVCVRVIAAIDLG